jgi:hypothetical protein
MTMKQTSPSDTVRNEPSDDLDRLLSRYFKTQMPSPWPAAPVVQFHEPASLLADRASTAAALQQRPLAVIARDPGRRARYTLAVSIAMLFGTCWYISSGIEPGNRAAPHNSNPAMNLDINLNRGSADGKDGLPELIDKTRKGLPDKPTPPVVDLNKLD